MADPKLTREAEALAGIAYANAVTMHESIIAGNGATGRHDATLLAALVSWAERIQAEARQEGYERGVEDERHGCIEAVQRKLNLAGDAWSAVVAAQVQRMIVDNIRARSRSLLPQPEESKP